MQVYAKGLVALLFAVLTAIAAAVTDGHISNVEWAQVAIAVVSFIGVWLTANVPGVAAHAKFIIAGVLAVLNLLVTYLAAGPITTAQWINLALAFVGAIMVWAVPNRGSAVN